MTPCARVRGQLAEIGLLLLQDKVLPSVVGLFTQRVVSGSWWGIPEGRAIFVCVESIEENDAVATRLINRRVTFVHRRLWPALVTLGAASEAWKTNGISDDAKGLLTKMANESERLAVGPPARELQERLLVAATSVHTESGRHEIKVESWPAWAARHGVKPLASVAAAREELEVAASRLGAKPATLPWNRRR